MPSPSDAESGVPAANADAVNVPPAASPTPEAMASPEPLARAGADASSPEMPRPDAPGSETPAVVAATPDASALDATGPDAPTSDTSAPAAYSLPVSAASESAPASYPSPAPAHDPDPDSAPAPAPAAYPTPVPAPAAYPATADLTPTAGQPVPAYADSTQRTPVAYSPTSAPPAPLSSPAPFAASPVAAPTTRFPAQFPTAPTGPPIPPAPLAPGRRTGLILTLVAIGIVLVVGAGIGIPFAIQSSKVSATVNDPLKPKLDPNGVISVDDVFPEELELHVAGETVTLDRTGAWDYEDCDGLGEDKIGKKIEDDCVYRFEVSYETDDGVYLLTEQVLAYPDATGAKDALEFMDDKDFHLDSLKTRPKATQRGWSWVNPSTVKRFVLVAACGTVEGFESEDEINEDFFSQQLMEVFDSRISRDLLFLIA